MLVDDNEIDNLINQKVVVYTLKNQGAEATVAGNGKEAVELLQAAPYDLILMDLQMPEMDGFEATMRVRETNKTIPIIAMTANAISGDRERCLAVGMNDYITKPVTLKGLSDILSKWST